MFTHFFLCFSSFLPAFLSFSVSVCLWLWLSASVALLWFMMSCMRAQQAVGVYTKHPSELTMPLFIALSKTECCTFLSFWRSGRRAVARGPFHNFSLVHGAVGWCAVSVWWLLLSKKMSQLITSSKHFHGQAYHKKSELRIWGLGKFAGLEMRVVFLE